MTKNCNNKKQSKKNGRKYYPIFVKYWQEKATKIDGPGLPLTMPECKSDTEIQKFKDIITLRHLLSLINMFSRSMSNQPKTVCPTIFGVVPTNHKKYYSCKQTKQNRDKFWSKDTEHKDKLKNRSQRQI